MIPLIKAKQESTVQNPKVAKLKVVDLGETELDPDSEQVDVQQKRDSGYPYNRPPNRVSSGTRFRFRANQSRGQVASRFPARLSKPFAKYGPPNHLNSNPSAHDHHAQQQRNKLQQHHAGQQQSVGIDNDLTQQEVPSPIRNLDFTIENPIASQNNEPFGMHTANYLPPQNQKLPAYSSADNFTPPSADSQNLVQSQNHHQISDATLFLSENAQAIQQLYGAPASNQDFAPGNEQFHADTGNQFQSDQLMNFESTLQSPHEFRSSLPSYASGTLSAHETLEQIQSLEKDRLIVQLQQALAQAQNNPSADAAGRYAQNQASFIQNEELLASLNQQMKSHVSTTPQSFNFATEGAAFSQSPFLPGTTINPLGHFPFNYNVATTARTPTTTTTTSTTTVTGLPSPSTSQSPKNDDTSQITSLQSASNQAGASAASSSPIGIPVYGGFVPTVIASNFIPSYSTSVFAPVRPVQPASDTSPTHFGIPIPTESTSGKPGSDSSIPTSTKPSSFKPPLTNQPGLALTPAITPVALPVQPIRPVAAPLHPFATHPVISNPLHPVLPVAGPAQVHPVQASTPAVTSSVQHTYGVQTALINPVVYKPVKAVYPVYYYPNVAYQLQKPALPSYPWSYAPSYAQTKPAQIWK